MDEQNDEESIYSANNKYKSEYPRLEEEASVETIEKVLKHRLGKVGGIELCFLLNFSINPFLIVFEKKRNRK